MTLEQLISPAVWEWTNKHKHLPDEQMINEFDKWLVENEEMINESVKNNIDLINECIETGKKNSRLLIEKNEDDIDLGNMDFDSFDDVKDKSDKPISGSIEDEHVDDTTVEPEETEAEETISGKLILRDPDEAKVDRLNVFNAVNSVYNAMVKNKTNHETNRHIWKKMDVSNVTDMTALLAFTDIPNADLRDWDVSSVETMEGMFYKSSFNNNSICKWKVKSCVNFLRMFTFSDFNQTLSHWTTGTRKEYKLDEHGDYIPDGKGGYEEEDVHVALPIVGGAEDEEAEIIQNFWNSKYDEWNADEIKENKNMKYNKNMKHILDFDTFINEGFGDFVKKGFNKIKSFFKNIALKLNNFVAIFDEDGKIIDATSPYTSLNYISNGEVDGVTAFTSVKNEYLNDNVQSIASIVEKPEYYGIIDKDSIEYRNYRTMVDMVNEHYSKYGEKLNEEAERVGFSSEGSGIKDIMDIKSDYFKHILNQAIKNVPAYKGRNAGGAILIWGAPGIGKSTIPKSVINAWNDMNSDKKTLLSVECGDLTVDGFSLPLPMEKTMGEYMKEHPEVKNKLSSQGYDVESKEYLQQKLKVSGEALKTWLPMYKLTTDNDENKKRDAIANGRLISDYDDEGQMRTIETTEGGIILFDEFFRANESIFKILMQLLLNRTFNNGEYVLGSKWAIIACSNRPEDDDEVRTGFDATGAVVGTRFSKQYNFVPDFDDWKKWAVKDGHFDDATITFLMQAKDPSTGEYTNWHTVRPGEYKGGKTAWPTPRTWSKLMVELHNVMVNDGYDSIQEIPMNIIRTEAAGAVGKEMADNYVQFLSTYKTSFSPSKVLNDPKYNIPEDMKCSEVIDRIKKHIDLKFDKDNLPSEEQIMNLFNTLERTFKASKDNYVRPLYVSLFIKFGFLENKEYRDAMLKTFPNFIKAFMKKYGLTSPTSLKDFLI